MNKLQIDDHLGELASGTVEEKHVLSPFPAEALQIVGTCVFLNVA